MTNEELRKALMDYYGTAMSSGNPMAAIELSQAESASDEKLIQMADELGWIKEGDLKLN